MTLTIRYGEQVFSGTYTPRLQKSSNFDSYTPSILNHNKDLSQSWFWTPEWQQMEREADMSFAEGRSAVFDDLESFLADLDS